jgi:hypothetical protein
MAEDSFVPTDSRDRREDRYQHNYLYHVLPGLLEDGLVVKEDRGWKPMDTA